MIDNKNSEQFKKWLQNRHSVIEYLRGLKPGEWISKNPHPDLLQFRSTW